MSTKPTVEGLRYGVGYPMTDEPTRIFAVFIRERDALDYRDHLSAAEGIEFEVVEL